MSTCCSSFSRVADVQFGAKIAAADLARYRKRGPGRTTRLLVEGLKSGAPPPASLLDIGAGIGALTHELLSSIDAVATVVDASAAYLDVAREESARRGFSERCTFHQADFVDLASTLPAAEAVTMDRVICCYPAHESLLEAALTHARRLFAFSYPRALWYVRLGTAVGNLACRLGRSSFRAFVHPPAAMHSVVRRHGFTLRSRSHTPIWCVEVWQRESTIASS